MVTTLKLEKDLNKISLEELVSSLRSHEIELEDDEPQNQGKPLALESKKNMILKFCRLWKKPLMDPHQKKTNCLFSPKESISCGSRGKGTS